MSMESWVMLSERSSIPSKRFHVSSLILLEMLHERLLQRPVELVREKGMICMYRNLDGLIGISSVLCRVTRCCLSIILL
jgi:hypothetical protein